MYMLRNMELVRAVLAGGRGVGRCVQNSMRARRSGIVLFFARNYQNNINPSTYSPLLSRCSSPNPSRLQPSPP